MTRLDGRLTAGPSGRLHSVAWDLGWQNVLKRPPRCHTNTKIMMTCYNQFSILSLEINQTCSISKVVTVIFIFWKPHFSISIRGLANGEPPCATLIMTASTPLFLTSFEIALLITNLSLFSYGYPDAARMSLWEEGGADSFNSDPKKRIYFYANHQEPPDIPYIWSQT